MIAYSFKDEGIRVWEYADRLMLKLLWQIVSPVAKKIISTRCYHLRGPKGVQTCLKHLRNCLEKGRFNYVIRCDIKGYYASIPRHLLLNQLMQHFQDRRLQNYWEQIVNIPVNCNANIINPTHGIPRRSTLSPFFSALYLSPLDKAIEKLQGVEDFRYMDDIIILAKTREQYRFAKKILFETLKALQLTLSPTKTKMGSLTRFHFLGGDFSVSRNTMKKIQAVHTELHQRSCIRALERLRQLRDNAANAATRQRYLLRWARW